MLFDSGGIEANPVLEWVEEEWEVKKMQTAWLRA